MTCSELLKKGRHVYVEGHLRTREDEKRSGHKQRYTEIVASRVEFLGVIADGAEPSRAGDTVPSATVDSTPPDSSGR